MHASIVISALALQHTARHTNVLIQERSCMRATFVISPLTHLQISRYMNEHIQE